MTDGSLDRFINERLQTAEDDSNSISWKIGTCWQPASNDTVDYEFANAAQGGEAPR